MSNDLLHRMRHSAAHVMARAVLELYPGTRIGMGPATEDGFFYDFEFDVPLTADDLPAIERRMRQIIAADDPFVYRVVEPDEARLLLINQLYKLELVEEIISGTGELGASGGPISTYRVGAFEDLCRGPHVASTGELDPSAMRLLGISGAYWRGDETRPMLQRISGTIWPIADELHQYLWRREEAKRHDHRKLGEELDLFAFDPDIGKGLPLWLPKGTAIREALEQWAKETEHRWGYQRVATPHIASADLYRRSGHLPYFDVDMYPPMADEDGEYYLKPMNCPHHMAVYAARPHSYRELPLRYAEYGTVYRYERSGELHGLLRVRGLTQNDAHIFCRLDQAREEFLEVMRLHAYYYRELGIEDYHMVLALRDPANLNKYHGDEEMWATAERITREAMEESAIPYVEEVGGAAHYGPKVDFVLRTVTGREYAASTNQLDLYLPARFELEFINDQGQPERPAVIHRAPLGSHERFVGFLIEHYAGAFPPWLAPVQVEIVPVGSDHEEYAAAIARMLVEQGLRAEAHPAGRTVGAAVRAAEAGKIPFVAIVGDREMANNSVSVRGRGGIQLGELGREEYAANLAATVASRHPSAELVDR
jgi:threonyl-tRNA synthetase